jgi:hypothetical protein
MLATDMRSRQPAFVADHVNQRLSRLDSNGEVVAIDVELDIDLVAHRWYFAGAPARVLE